MFLERILVIASAMLASGWLLTAAAINNPPYEFYGYLADATDDPPVNYMKVVEPGRTGDANASYVVLGISFPRTYQARPGVSCVSGWRVERSLCRKGVRFG